MVTMAFRTLIRGASLGTMAYGYHSLGGLAIDEYMSQQYGEHLQFLTIQGLALACLTMATSLLYEVLPSFTGLQTAKRYLTVMAMPLSVVISSIYWTLISLFPHLILQKSLSEPTAPNSSSMSPELFRIPLSIDLALHAVPCISLLIDFFFFEKRYSSREVKVGAPIAAVGFSIWYALWVEHCARMNNGNFPYPFLTENTLGIRIGIYVGATFIAIFSFKFINQLHF